MNTNHYAGIDPHIVSVIERETNKLRGRFGLTEADLADIRQDLHLGVWSGLGKAASNINREAAVNRIVDNLVRDWIRHRQRDCRDWRRVAVSINEPCLNPDDGSLETVADLTDLDAVSRAAAGRPPAWHEHRDGMADAAEALRMLPGKLRAMADALEAADGNLSEVARAMGVTPKKARVMLGELQRATAWLRDTSGGTVESSDFKPRPGRKKIFLKSWGKLPGRMTQEGV